MISMNKETAILKYYDGNRKIYLWKKIILKYWQNDKMVIKFNQEGEIDYENKYDYG